MERRLAAILAADVAGYSRMMATNEKATLEALQRHRSEVLIPAIAGHHGRVVKLMGDGILAEFSSVVEACDCAVKVQRDMTQRNESVDNDVRIAFRIGVHIGDVLVEGEDLYGDGVNIAARLEAIADIGGVCISGAAHDEIEMKLDLSFRALGPQTLKNIPRPVVAYAVDVDGISGVPSEPTSMKQEIRYCRTPEGVRIAYAVVGKGPSLVRCGRWFTHLEHEWKNESIFPAAIMKSLATEFQLLRYDARGTGMSDWEVEKSPWKPGFVIWTQSSPPLDSSGLLCSGSRKASRSPSPMRPATLSAYQGSSCVAAMHLAGASVRGPTSNSTKP
jgi:class 3 adenylate cyclase